ncbi:MAG: hypothetical protein AAB551_03745 [Patescibacteria group bacterium]
MKSTTEAVLTVPESEGKPGETGKYSDFVRITREAKEFRSWLEAGERTEVEIEEKIADMCAQVAERECDKPGVQSETGKEKIKRYIAMAVVFDAVKKHGKRDQNFEIDNEFHWAKIINQILGKGTESEKNSMRVLNRMIEAEGTHKLDNKWKDSELPYLKKRIHDGLMTAKNMMSNVSSLIAAETKEVMETSGAPEELSLEDCKEMVREAFPFVTHMALTILSEFTRKSAVATEEKVIAVRKDEAGKYHIRPQLRSLAGLDPKEKKYLFGPRMGCPAHVAFEGKNTDLITDFFEDALQFIAMGMFFQLKKRGTHEAIQDILSV